MSKIDPRVLLRLPIDFKKGIKLYPPSVQEAIEEPCFGQYVAILTQKDGDIMDNLIEANKNVLNSISSFPTAFQYLMLNCQKSKEYAALAKKAFEFFIHDEVNFFFEQGLIVVGQLEQIVQDLESINDLVFLSSGDFFQFQNAIRECVGAEQVAEEELPNLNENPQIAAIKAKARLRDRVKRKQSQKNGISLSTTLLAICCMGIGLTPLNIGEVGYGAITPLMSMMQSKEKYETDIRSLLAGTDPKKIKPTYWIND